MHTRGGTQEIADAVGETPARVNQIVADLPKLDSRGISTTDTPLWIASKFKGYMQ